MPASERVGRPVAVTDRLDRNGVRAVARDMVLSLVHLGILLLAAGNPFWTSAWLCIGLGLALQIASAAVLIKTNPEVLNQRGQVVRQDTRRFDRIFVVSWILLTLATSVVAGLDAGRFGWSRMAAPLQMLGALLYLLAYPLGAWAMAVNRYFEPTVRIQDDRGHRVCTSGPYRAVRHPGYLAAIVGAPGYPLLLGSWWAFVPTAAVIALFIVRTGLEDRTLLRELPGYAAYARKTPYRLLPLLW